MNGAKRSIRIGRMLVVLCSVEISFIVCKKRSCKAIGCSESNAAACTGFSAAFGVDDFSAALPLRLGRAGHRALHAFGQHNKGN
jgi:hypothetical protein